MRIKKLGRISTFVVSASVVALLSACGGQSNPLKENPPKEAAQFLVDASQSAEKALHIFNAPGGYYYGECMNGRAEISLCDKLYSAMAQYGKTTQAFRGVTLEDLKDEGVFKVLKTDYQQIRFNTV